MVTNYSRKGRSLERAQAHVLKLYKAEGIACHANNALVAPGGQVVEGEPYDFEALYNNVFYAWDCKECAGNRWPLPSRTQLHQVKDLLDVHLHGGQAFFLVCFTGKDNMLVRFNVQDVCEAIKDGEASMEPGEGFFTSLDVLGIFQQ